MMKTLPILFVALLIMISGCQQTSPTKSKGGLLDVFSAWFNNGEKSTDPTNRDCFSSSPTSQHTKTRVFLLAAGANTGELLKTSSDVEKFSNSVQRHFHIPETQICHLPNAFKAELENALISLKPHLIQGDLVILYFSGHGSQIRDDNGDEKDRMDETLVTRDVVGKEYPRAKHLLRDDQFTALVNALPTDRILTVMDTCFSLGMYLAKTEPNPLLANARIKFFVKGEIGTQISRVQADQDNLIKNEVGEFDALKGLLLAAASEKENALEIPDEGGLFTLKFVEQLEKRGDIKQAFVEAAQEVQTITKNGQFEEQTPQAIGDWGVVGD